jgi:V/A-type H+-transporting ATPase subunit E
LDQEKLSKFRQAVFSDVESKISVIQQEAEELKKASLAQTENEQLNDAYSYIQSNVAKIKAEFKLIVAKADLAAKQEVLLQRENYRRSMLAAVRQRLVDFTKTDEYKSYLLSKLEEVSKSYPLSHSVILFQEEDSWLEQEVKTKFAPEDCVFQSSPAIKIGGFIIRNEESGYLIDETLESKLQEQIPYFNQNCRIAAE